MGAGSHGAIPPDRGVIDQVVTGRAPLAPPVKQFMRSRVYHKKAPYSKVRDVPQSWRLLHASDSDPAKGAKQTWPHNQQNWDNAPPVPGGGGYASYDG